MILFGGYGPVDSANEFSARYERNFEEPGDGRMWNNDLFAYDALTQTFHNVDDIGQR